MRETRATVRAVGERVAEAAVAGIEQLAQAVVAGGAVGRDGCARLARARALADKEAGLPGRLDRLRRHVLDARERRRLVRKTGEETLDGVAIGLDLEQHPARVVQDVAVQPHLLGKAVDVGPEADSLDRPVHARADARHVVDRFWRPVSTRP
jgi:hypothetical protein